MKVGTTKKFILILFLSGLWSWASYISAQDPVYSQFYNAPLQLNPAFAGNTFGPFITANYRKQWPNLESSYETYSISFDQFSTRFNSGFGAYLLTDDAGNGILKTTKLSGLYAYRLKIKNELHVKIGLEVGMIQRRLNWGKLIFFDQLDPQFGAISPGGTPYPSAEVQPDRLSQYSLDVSSGVLLYNPLFYAGISLKHLNNPNDAFFNNSENIDAGLPIRFSFHGGMQFNLGRGNKKDEGTFISPNILFVKQGGFTQLNAGAYGSLGQFFLGGWYRHAGQNGDAVILSAGVRSGIFKFSYSFDYTISELSISSGGSHEVGISINFDSFYPRESRYNDCLSLFR